MMQKYFVLVLFLLMTSSHAQADLTTSNHSTENRDGLGIIFGEPTGFTGKFWLAPNRAIDAGIAFSFSSFLNLYSDYLFQFPGAFGGTNTFIRELSPYVGAGAELFISDNSSRINNEYFTSSGSSMGFGIRIPLGVEWLPRKAPIGVFAELVPGIGVIPSTFGFFQGGLGARYYF